MQKSERSKLQELDKLKLKLLALLDIIKTGNMFTFCILVL